SMGCTKIFAEPGTLTGSIGVVSGKFALKGLYDKIGVTTDVLSRGKNSGWMSSDAPFTESEREVMVRMMKDIYAQFTEKAAQGRNMPLEELEKLAGGRLYTGVMAKEKKLVDEVGTLEDAIAEAKRLAGLNEADKIDRMMLPKPRSFLDELLGSGVSAEGRVAGAVGPRLDLTSIAPELAAPLQAAETLRRMFSEPA